MGSIGWRLYDTQDVTSFCCFDFFFCNCACMSVCSYCRWQNCMRWECVCVWQRERGGTWPVLFSLTLSFHAFQRHNGEILTAASVKHLSHRRFVVSFQLDNAQRTDQDLYRCVTQSSKGSGVSNFAELVVKGKHHLLLCLSLFSFPCPVSCRPSINSPADFKIMWFSALFSHFISLNINQTRERKLITAGQYIQYISYCGMRIYHLKFLDIVILQYGISVNSS